MSSLPSAPEREAARKRHEKWQEERDRVERKVAAATVKEVGEHFDELCETAFEGVTRLVRWSVEEAKNERFVSFGEDFQRRFDSEGCYSFDEMLLLVARRVSRHKGYKAKVEERTRACDNAGEAANVDGVSYQTWTETQKGILVTW